MSAGLASSGSHLESPFGSRCKNQNIQYSAVDALPLSPLATTEHRVIFLDEAASIARERLRLSPAASNIPSFVDNLEASSTATSRQSAERKPQLWRCDIPGCKSDRTFSREGDLKRHCKVKHESRKPFVCLARGCFKGPLPPAFPRADKLTAHIKACHDHRNVFTRCPVECCNFQAPPSCNLDILAIHIKHTHSRVDSGSAFVNASALTSLKCPFWSCGKYFKHGSFLGHFNAHSTAEVTDAVAGSYWEGLLVHYHSAPMPEAGIEHLSAVGVICPVCNIACGDFEDFKQHFWTRHLFSEGGAEHFRSWCSTLDQHVSASRRSNRNRHVPWERMSRYWFFSETGTVRCPSCSLSVNLRSDWHRESTLETHHLSLLRPTEEVIVELFPYRMQIVRLHPDFATHPIFADLGPRDGEYYDFVASLASASLSQETPAAS